MKAVIFSLFRKLIRKLWLLPPVKKIGHALQKAWKGTKPQGYPFLSPYATNVLRVLGWVVLVVGIIGSIVLGLEIANGGFMVWTLEIVNARLIVGKTELLGVGLGVSMMVLGIICSFLAWLFLLVNRELIYLFIHVEENTRNTAERITKESG